MEDEVKVKDAGDARADIGLDHFRLILVGCIFVSLKKSKDVHAGAGVGHRFGCVPPLNT